MSEARQTLAIRRILVALDASSHSLAALRAAIDLATRFQAELIGLFVEEERLLQLAALPVVQEVGLFSATRRHLAGEELARQLRMHGRRVRRIFTLTMQQARVTWSFRSQQGTVVTQVLTAASETEADLLVLGKAGRSLLRRGRLGSTVRELLGERHFGLALVMPEDTRLGTPLTVLFDGSPAAERALLAAVTLRAGWRESAALNVILLAVEGYSALRLQEQAASLVGDGGSLHYRPLSSAAMPALAHVLLTEESGLVVLPARSPALQNDVLIALLEYLELPVLLVT